MSLIFAIDPGPKASGWCSFDGRKVLTSGVLSNDELLFEPQRRCDVSEKLAIEMIACYGMAVGHEVFETCVWIGRFQQAWYSPDSVRLVFRKDVKMHLCNDSRAKDPNIRQALLDLLGPQGTKKAPGPTYGVSGHAWAALAVAVTVADALSPMKQATPSQMGPAALAAPEQGLDRRAEPRVENEASRRSLDESAEPATHTTNH